MHRVCAQLLRYRERSMKLPTQIKAGRLKWPSLLKAINPGFKTTVPQHGTIWRINFSRVEYDTKVENGQNVKLKDEVTGRDLPEHNWVWSAQGVINMHYPERWGFLVFSD